MCSFCGGRMEPGTGKMLVKRDGTLLHFCASKCEKNQALGRTPRKATWVRKAQKSPATPEKAAKS